MPLLLNRSLACRVVVLALFWVVLVGTAPRPAQAQNPPPRLFGSIEFIGGSLSALPQWTRVLRKIRAEAAVYETCDRGEANRDIGACPSPAVAAWRDHVRSLRGLPPRRQLAELNSFLNRWIYRLDSENFNVEDYWASPLEFLARSGDCEDYAIIKYVSLKALGFDVKDLRIVVVQDVVRNLPHAVLAVYLERDIFIMDSLFEAVLSHRQVTFYRPYYSVNETTRWAHVPTQQPRRSVPSGVIR
jgi:predicted transglutaminase-like cysteine proteinase